MYALELGGSCACSPVLLLCQNTMEIHLKLVSIRSVLDVFTCFIMVLNFWVCFRLLYNGLGSWGLISVCLKMVLALVGVFVVFYIGFAMFPKGLGSWGMISFVLEWFCLLGVFFCCVLQWFWLLGG